jgi:hypothetical protein
MVAAAAQSDQVEGFVEPRRLIADRAMDAGLARNLTEDAADDRQLFVVGRACRSISPVSVVRRDIVSAASSAVAASATRDSTGPTSPEAS